MWVNSVFAASLTATLDETIQEQKQMSFVCLQISNFPEYMLDEFHKSEQIVPDCRNVIFVCNRVQMIVQFRSMHVRHNVGFIVKAHL